MAGGRGSGTKQHALAGDTAILRIQTGREFDAVFVQQERVLESAAGKQSFGESGQEDDIEAASARFFDRADEDAAVTAPGRFGAEKAQAFREDVVDFVERSGADVAHGFQLAENAEHGFGTAERHLREIGEPVEPDAPCFRGRQGARASQSEEERKCFKRSSC